MIPFEIAEPRSLREATSLLDPDDATIRPLGGGTALMLMMKAGVFQATRLVSLRAIEPRYSEINVEADGRSASAGSRRSRAWRIPGISRAASL
jgi:aerobic carbon-monoxide dehydrogenase medium subunit